MKNYHVILITLIAGVMLGAAIPAKAANRFDQFDSVDCKATPDKCVTITLPNPGLDVINRNLDKLYEKPEEVKHGPLTVRESNPVWYWLSAIFGGSSAVFGFFGLIYGLFIFSRRPSIRGFFGGAVSVCSWLFFSGYWYALTWGGAGKGSYYGATSYSDAAYYAPDLTPFYWYWGLSAIAGAVWGFWYMLDSAYKRTHKA